MKEGNVAMSICVRPAYDLIYAVPELLQWSDDGMHNQAHGFEGSIRQAQATSMIYIEPVSTCNMQIRFEVSKGPS